MKKKLEFAKNLKSKIDHSTNPILTKNVKYAKNNVYFAMVKQTSVVIERLEQMVNKYAAKPELFFKDGKPNMEYLKQLADENITIDPKMRGGYACIRGTRAAVCDIIGDTWHLRNPKDYWEWQYADFVQNEFFDISFAYFLLNPEKIGKDYYGCSGRHLPKELCG